MKNLVTYVLISFLIVGSLTSSIAQEAEKVFQQAMMKEEGEGNLTEAIDMYNTLVDDTSVAREMRANALLHIGICNEKLGKENALNVYQKIISDYSDQVDIVSIARKKVLLLKGSTTAKLNTGLVSERIEKDVNGDHWLYKFSPNGRYYLYTCTENNTDELMIYDLQTGRRDSLTTGNRTGYGFDNTQPWGARWSPNGEKIAYNWGYWGHSPKGNKIREIHLIDKNGDNKQVILTGKEGEIPELQGFTNDGKNLFGTLEIQKNDEKIQQLVLISIVNKNYEVLKNFGIRHTGYFSYSPDGKYLLYEKSKLNSRNRDVFVMSMTDMKETQITNNNTNNWEPVWSPNGDQILFLSDRIGSNGLYKIAFENGKSLGKPKLIKDNLGDRGGLMGVSNNGAVYYHTETRRNDIYTIDLDEKFNNNVNKITQITNPALKQGGGVAKYSKDGRYISYLSRNPNIHKPGNEEIDFNLGDKYYIHIYDTKTMTSKLLNLDLYFNHHSWKYRYHVPSWSYHEKKLLVHGMIKENYEGGFFAVDVDTEKITPILTVPNCKQGTEYKLFGNSMVFSKSNKDKIFYSSPNWKHLMEYNMTTKEEKSIVHIEDGFWFEGFLDDAETKCIAYNRFGKFISDINTKETIKIGEKDMGWHLGASTDKKYNFYFLNNGRETKILKRVSVDGSEADKEINFDDYFQNNATYDTFDNLHPTKNEMLLEVNLSSGTDIYKLTNVFE
jgi:Tol biopolymer transport system component